ncbi:MAG: TIGR03668 family PPOX class F420-dependent oxidoreductase [Pseudomonadota bacterium]|nr:TIGR03668 family PPOX class F420-dependent oxidoreductase [Pseudomonadota bacterium]
MLTDQQRQFLERHPIARFSSADLRGQPHVVPVCFTLGKEKAYFSIDQKPKRATAQALKRVRNVLENPQVALLVDRYEEDWTQLGWVMIQGQAEVLSSGDEHDCAQRQLKQRYRPLRDMHIDDLPVIAIRIDHVISWGNLADQRPPNNGPAHGQQNR